MTTDVTVVIPTVLRPELDRALASVRAQDYMGAVQVLVVADVVESRLQARRLELHHNEEVIVTGGGKRGGGARNIGVQASASQWIAYLDDDDEWEADHLSTLLATVEKEGWDGDDDLVVIASRARQVLDGTDRSGVVVVPHRGISEGERVEEYLFRKRELRLDRPSFFTPTMLVSRRLALTVPWNTSLVRHQDWDWLIRAQRAGATVRHTDSPTCIVRVGSAGSVSAMSDWASSLNWVQDQCGAWDNRTVADFIAGQCLRYALTARSARGVWRCLRAIWATRRLPAKGPLLLGLTGLAGRASLEKQMFRGFKSSRDASVHA